nr:hypothetical protein [Nocardia farcinica]
MINPKPLSAHFHSLRPFARRIVVEVDSIQNLCVLLGLEKAGDDVRAIHGEPLGCGFQSQIDLETRGEHIRTLIPPTLFSALRSKRFEFLEPVHPLIETTELDQLGVVDLGRLSALEALKRSRPHSYRFCCRENGKPGFAAHFAKNPAELAVRNPRHHRPVRDHLPRRG